MGIDYISLVLKISCKPPPFSFPVKVTVFRKLQKYKSELSVNGKAQVGQC